MRRRATAPPRRRGHGQHFGRLLRFHSPEPAQRLVVDEHGPQRVDDRVRAGSGTSPDPRDTPGTGGSHDVMFLDQFAGSRRGDGPGPGGRPSRPVRPARPSCLRPGSARPAARSPRLGLRWTEATISPPAFFSATMIGTFPVRSFSVRHASTTRAAHRSGCSPSSVQSATTRARRVVNASWSVARTVTMPVASPPVVRPGSTPMTDMVSPVSQSAVGDGCRCGCHRAASTMSSSSPYNSWRSRAVPAYRVNRFRRYSADRCARFASVEAPCSDTRRRWCGRGGRVPGSP